jgi:hypothetical protein
MLPEVIYYVISISEQMDNPQECTAFFLYNGYNKLHRQNLMRVEAGAIVRLNAVEADPFQE